jgi:hypothetical protein
MFDIERHDGKTDEQIENVRFQYVLKYFVAFFVLSSIQYLVTIVFISG